MNNLNTIKFLLITTADVFPTADYIHIFHISLSSHFSIYKTTYIKPYTKTIEKNKLSHTSL